MLFDEAIKEKIESIFQTTPPFNDTFVTRIRSLETDYGLKLTWL